MIRITPVLALLFLIGCGDEAEPERGSMVSVHGTILDSAASEPTVEPALLWFGPPPDILAFVVADAAVVGQFPADFSLPIANPPPAEALQTTPGAAFGMGHIVALAPDHGAISYPDELGSVLGAADQFIVSYNSEGGYILWEVNATRLLEVHACNQTWIEALGACFAGCSPAASSEECAECQEQCAHDVPYDCWQEPLFDYSSDSDALYHPAAEGFETSVTVHLGAELTLFDAMPDWASLRDTPPACQ